MIVYIPALIALIVGVVVSEDIYQQVLEARGITGDQQRMLLENKTLFIVSLGIVSAIIIVIQIWFLSVLFKCRRYFIDLLSANTYNIGMTMVTVLTGDAPQIPLQA